MSGNLIAADYEGKNLYVGAYGKSTGPTPSYDNISFYVGGEDAAPRGMAFNNDGTKLFMFGLTTDTIYQYSLPTPYILTGMFYDNISFYVGGVVSSPRGMAFNNDGTKLFMVGFITDTIYQYSLPTPYILTGMFYDNISFYVGGEDTTPLGMAFNNDGTKLFIVGDAANTIYQYSLPMYYNLDTTRGVVFRFTGDKDYNYTLKETILPRKGKTRYNDISPSKFGWSIAIDKHGKVLIVGAKDDSEIKSGSGAVYVYKRDTSLDTYTIKIKQDTVTVNHHVGSSVAISDDGSTIIFGASRV